MVDAVDDCQPPSQAHRSRWPHQGRARVCLGARLRWCVVSVDIYSDEGYFAVVPEYVLDADVSPQAVRLYAVLRRYADQRTGKCHPSRETLAGRLHVSSPKVVDRASKELVGIGVLEIIPRWIDSSGQEGTGKPVFQNAPGRHRTSNGYRIKRHPEVGRGERNDNGGRGVDDTGVGNGMTQKREPCCLEPGEPEERYAASKTTRQNTPTRKHPSAPRESDDETGGSSETPRPLRSPAGRKTTQEAKDVAETRGTSGKGLALRFQRGMDAYGSVGNHTDVPILKKKITELNRKKIPWPVLAEMVRLFTENPSAYTPPGSTKKSWVQFLASAETLRVHAERVLDQPQDSTPEEIATWQAGLAEQRAREAREDDLVERSQA